MGGWTLAVSDYVPVRPDPLVITMPGHAWNIAASVLSGAVYGEYNENPFDFSRVGYLDPPPHPDIGIEIVVDPTWTGNGIYFAQCVSCLRESPVMASQDEADEWLRSHEAERHLEGQAPEET